jgi:hypothetical protein
MIEIESGRKMELARISLRWYVGDFGNQELEHWCMKFWTNVRSTTREYWPFQH